MRHYRKSLYVLVANKHSSGVWQIVKHAKTKRKAISKLQTLRKKFPDAELICVFRTHSQPIKF